MIKESFIKADDQTIRQLSMKLISASNQNKFLLVNALTQKFIKCLKIEFILENNDYEMMIDKIIEFANSQKQPVSRYAWFLGRLLFSQPTTENNFALKLKKLIEKLLMHETLVKEFAENNFYQAWAYSYIYARLPIDTIKEKMFTTANAVSQQDMSTYLWTHIMVAYACVKSFDYKSTQKEVDIIAATKNNNLIAALETIPFEDYRAWAIAIMSNIQKNNFELSNALTEVLENEFLEADDRKLAESYIPQNSSYNETAEIEEEMRLDI